MSSNAYEKYAGWNRSNRPYVLAAVAAIIVFMLVAPITEKGDNMSSTVEKGDVVILHKKTFSEKRGLPEYEDVIVFKTDFYDGDVKGQHRVSRVIGLPGDTIEIKGGNVYRNGEKLEHKNYEKGKTTGTVKPLEIGSGKVFVLNDNREGSVDSRNSDVGSLSLSNIRGKALIIIWPFGNLGVIE